MKSAREMLLARQRPLTGGFVKRLPVDAAAAPRARGFGARQKVVAAPRKALRIGAALADMPIVVAEGDASAGWASDVDWVGASAESVAPLTNGHAPDAFVEELPPPEAVPAPEPELRTLN